MRRQSTLMPTQLVLPLVRESNTAPIEPGSKALLQAVADLLLEALGNAMEEPSERRGAYEPEDHA